MVWVEELNQLTKILMEVEFKAWAYLLMEESQVLAKAHHCQHFFTLDANLGKKVSIGISTHLL